MKHLPLFLILIMGFFSCSNREDPVVAQVYYHKLYLSEVRANMPVGLSQEDSLALVNDFVDSWIKEQLIIHEAEHRLSLPEKNFDRSLDEYRNHLLVNAYYDKLLREHELDEVSDAELKEFVRSFGKQYTVDREIVKVNYVKLSAGSRLIGPVKSILFDESRRETEKDALVAMLGDSVEYLLEDTWLYLEDLQNDVQFDFDNPSRKYVEKEVDGYRYLMVILDYKSQRSVSETEEEQASARMMLLNQRKMQFIDDYVNKLYEKAIREGKITH